MTLVILVMLTSRSVALCNELQEAVKVNDLEKTKTVLKEDPNLIFSKDTNGSTVLHWATERGFKKMAELLLANKADVNAKDNDDWTPLHRASASGFKDVAAVLLANNADVNAKDKGGWTPLHRAMRCGPKGVVAILLANKADVNAKDKFGRTPLLMAAQSGLKEIVELLLACNVDVNAKDDDGDSPLREAEGNSHKEVAELLRRMASQIDPMGASKSRQKPTPPVRRLGSNGAQLIHTFVQGRERTIDRGQDASVGSHILGAPALLTGGPDVVSQRGEFRRGQKLFTVKRILPGAHFCHRWYVCACHGWSRAETVRALEG